MTSVKDLFYRATGDMEQAWRDIAAAGYEGVEMFDGNVADLAERPDDLHELLNATGLELVGVYTGANFVYDEILPDELDRIGRAAQLAQTYGAEHLVVGGGAVRSVATPQSDYDRLADALDTVAALAEDHGLSACFHPHLGTIVQSPDQVEKVFERSRIGFCPDTAHLAAGGGDPAELIRRYGDRVRHVHLKDLRKGKFLPLGEGDINFADVLAAITAIGYDGWLMVELDSYAGDPADAARISKSFLEGVLLT